MVAEVGVLLELRVVEALSAVEDPRPARLRREPAQRTHDRVTHPLRCKSIDVRVHDRIQGGAVELLQASRKVLMDHDLESFRS